MDKSVQYYARFIQRSRTMCDNGLGVHGRCYAVDWPQGVGHEHGWYGDG